MNIQRREFLLGGSSLTFLTPIVPFATILTASAGGKCARIVIIKPVEACAASERGYGALLAKHLMRWLATGGIKADIADDKTLDATLTGRQFALLPLCTAPSTSQLAALERFMTRGGKLFVFYSLSVSLGQLMGIKVIGYKRPVPGTYGDVRFTGNRLAGFPVHFQQSSANIVAIEPIAGRSHVLAQWANRQGQLWQDAAIVASSKGWWMSHVLLADGDEEAKAQFLMAVAGIAVPGVWDPKAWQAHKQSQLAKDRAWASAQKPRPGEIHAVWDQSGLGLYPGDWPRTIRLLSTAHITDLYINVAGAGFAHYNSSVLPKSSIYERQGDQLTACLAAARGTGIRVHAWIICFNSTHATPNRLNVFTKNGWRLKDRISGRLTEYLNPANKTLQALLFSAMTEICQKYPVQGIHADFVRYYERVQLPKNATKIISSFVAQARTRIKATRPSAIFSVAAFGKYPSCIQAVGQDWEAWIDAGIVDILTCMNYITDSAKYKSFVMQQGRTRAHARRIISGIGVTANESRLTPRQVMEQILMARQAGLAGVALFDLDYFLATSVLPILRLGMF